VSSFNSKLRDEFLNGEIFYSMKEIRVLAERWRVHYNTVRPHSSLGYRLLAPEAWLTTTWGVEKWKPLRAPTSPHPQPRLSIYKDNCARLINLAGTKDQGIA
jgi:putative transposase